MAVVFPLLLEDRFRFAIIFLIVLLQSNLFVTSSVTCPQQPVVVAFERDGSTVDEGYVTPAYVEDAYRTDLVVSINSADTLVIVANNVTCRNKSKVFAAACFPEAGGISIPGMNISVPEGPIFKWSKESLDLYASGNSATGSLQFNKPRSLEPGMKATSMKLYYTSPAESNLTYGLLGLGKNSTLLQRLTLDQTIPSSAYGLYLGAEIKDYRPGAKYSTPNISYPGSLVLGGYDRDLFGGGVLAGKLSDTDLPRIEMSEIVLHNDNSRGTEWPQSTETLTVDVDSTTPEFHLPGAFVTRLAYDIGASLDKGYYNYDTYGGKYVGNVTMKLRIPSSLTLANPDVPGAVQELTITIPASEFYQPHPVKIVSTVGNKTTTSSKPRYYLPVRPTTKRFVAGRAFLKSMYLVINYDKGEFYLSPTAWRSEGKPNLVTICGPPSLAPQTRTPTSIIVGGTVGGVVGVSILAWGIFWWLRKRRNTQSQTAHPQAQYPQAQYPQAQYGQQMVGPHGMVKGRVESEYPPVCEMEGQPKGHAQVPGGLVLESGELEA